MDKNNLKNKVSDVVEELNVTAKELIAFEGFEPNRYLIKSSDAKKIVVEVVSSRLDEQKTVHSRIELIDGEETMFAWFFATAERQVKLYETLLHQLKNLIQQENLYVVSSDHQQWKVNNRRLYKKPVVQQLVALANFNLFNLLKSYLNYQVTDWVQVKTKETKATIQQKMTTELKVVKDAIVRINFFEGAPNFVVEDQFNQKSFKIKVLLNNQIILKQNLNWTRDSLTTLYNCLGEFSVVTKTLLNTLDFYRKAEGTREPVLFTSKLFSKKWLLTPSGEMLNQVIDLPSFLHQVVHWSNEQ